MNGETGENVETEEIFLVNAITERSPTDTTKASTKTKP